jgi:hypothetical protein
MAVSERLAMGVKRLTVAFAKRLAKGKISFISSSGRSVIVLQWSIQMRGPG